MTMSGNQIRGPFPKEVCSWEELRILILSRNELIGSIPTCVADLSSLDVLVVSKNELEGQVPDMSGLREMKWLALDNNTGLTGDVTLALNNMTKLQLLHIDDTKLGGHLDHNFLRGSVNITEVDLSRCSGFSGRIPTHLLELPKLEVLDLHGLSLHGSFPDVTNWTSSIRYLSLAGNSLNGSIEAIGRLTNLRHLDLAANHFTGSLHALSNLTSTVERLYLADNSFGRGPIPLGLGSLTELTELNLENTSLTGTVPSFLGGLNKLKLLDLGGNKLNGSIPETLSTLSSLEFLLLNGNEDLKGVLPESFSQLSRLRMVLLDRTALNGSVDVLCGLPAFDNKSGGANRTGIISADCGGANETAEVACKCCTYCCSDSKPSDCHDIDETSTLELEWQYGYTRESFDFGGSAYFKNQPYLSQTP
jgi:Leucine-rich repeat (LRR) protein